jgi:hypothetical protein
MSNQIFSDKLLVESGIGIAIVLTIGITYMVCKKWDSDELEDITALPGDYSGVLPTTSAEASLLKWTTPTNIADDDKLSGSLPNATPINYSTLDPIRVLKGGIKHNTRKKLNKRKQKKKQKQISKRKMKHVNRL